jgi:hypothetical protein
VVDAWTVIEVTLGIVGSGGALATNGTDVFGLAGGTTQALWQYDRDLTRWATLPDTATNVGWGGSLTFLDTKLYGLSGGRTDEFWAYTMPVYKPYVVAGASGGLTFRPLLSPLP